MKHVSYTDLRQNLARHIEDAVESRGPLLVTRQGGKEGVVILSETEFSSWQETCYLLSNPINAAGLHSSIRAAEQGLTQEHELIHLPA